jgi:NADH pyrophosphatase NudC (nudix superfamily)
MAIPEFIVELRRHVGHAPLWLLGLTAVVIRDGQVLLVKRCDNHAWTPVTGIVEPGEDPADGAVREVFEEAGVHVTARRLDWVHVARPTGGEPFITDDESLEARWFDPSELPAMSSDMCRHIELAGEDSLSAPTIFERSSP